MGATLVPGIKGPREKDGALTRVETRRVRIVKGHNPRQVTGDLSTLRASIKKEGILQPLLVRPTRGRRGHFDLIAGERRLRVARLLNMETVPVTVREDIRTALEAQALAVAENSQDGRVNLNMIEIGDVAKRARKDGWGIQSISTKMAVEPMRVRRALILAGAPADIRARVIEGSLSVHAGITLAKIDADTQRKIRKDLHPGITAKEINKLAREVMASAGRVSDLSDSKRRKGKERDANLRVRLGLREQNALLAEMAYYYVNAEEDSVGTVDYHELRGALGYALRARGDLTTWMLPDVESKCRTNARFECLVKAAAAKYKPDDD